MEGELKGKEKMNIKKLRVRQLILIVVDTLSIVIALYGSLVLRFDGTINQEYISNISIF